MPKGTEAPGYSLPLPGFSDPTPVPSIGFTKAAGPPDVAPGAMPSGELAEILEASVDVALWAAPAGARGMTAQTPTPINGAALTPTIHFSAPRVIGHHKRSPHVFAMSV